VPYAEAYEYVDLFPKARYQFVPGAGHIVWWEQPDAYLEAVRGFLVE
jgi:pimeloyl-ACP methyl ester carboxylesterase